MTQNEVAKYTRYNMDVRLFMSIVLLDTNNAFSHLMCHWLGALNVYCQYYICEENIYMKASHWIRLTLYVYHKLNPTCLVSLVSVIWVAS